MKLSKRTWASFLLIGLTGQFAWTIENMYFNIYLYNTISTDPNNIALMVAASAIVATLATFVMGAFSDRLARANRSSLWLHIMGFVDVDLRAHKRGKRRKAVSGLQRGGSCHSNADNNGLCYDIFRLNLQRRRVQRACDGYHDRRKQGEGRVGTCDVAAAVNADHFRCIRLHDTKRGMAEILQYLWDNGYRYRYSILVPA